MLEMLEISRRCKRPVQSILYPLQTTISKLMQALDAAVMQLC